jgi:putative sterol carrier protein
MQVYGADKPPVIHEGRPDAKPTLAVTISDDLMLKMAVGKANPVTSFMSGKVKLTGNIMLAQKLEAMFRSHNGYQRTRELALDLAKDNAYLRSKL